jgi:small subunit ribosomal protein S1
MKIDEEGCGVEFIAGNSTNDLIQFRIVPWEYSSNTTPHLTIAIARYELIKAFHDGITEFIRSEYRPADWCHIDNPSNINWGALLKPPSVPNQNWLYRLAMYGGGRQRRCETGLETIWDKLTLEQQWLVVLRDVLLKTAMLAANHQITEVHALVSLYQTLPIDLALREIDPNWYEERRGELSREYGLDEYLIRRQKPQRRRLSARARLATLKIGQLVDGTVRRIKPYGVFVDIGGYYTLLHIRAISQLPVEHPEQIFQVEDWVRAMIVWMDYEQGRVSLSTLELEPEPGDMLRSPLTVYEQAEKMADRYRELVLSRLETE